MGSMEKEKYLIYDESKKLVKTSLACFLSFLISVVGVLVLMWWVVEYRPQNTQQWMVPLGLVLSGTPMVVWFSVFASELCNSEVDSSCPSRPVLVYDPEINQKS